MNIPDETRRDILDLCKYHYENNLVGMVFFDPASVDANYPRGNINVLVVLHIAPEEARERYETVSEILLQNLAPEGKTLTCRVQTAGEINVLAQMKLPLLEIYLRNAEIIYDPQQILLSAREAISS